MTVPHQQISFGIDLGGTSTRVGAYDADLQLIKSLSFPTRVTDGPHSCVEEIARAIVDLLPFCGSDSSVLGVGLGSPGPINLVTGILGLLPNLPGWENFPLRDALHAATGLPVYLESDANAAAIAEWKLGAGRETGLDSLAMLTLGTGVGSGLILNGRVWHGMFGMGGEVGHVSIEPDGPMCGCGTRGCLEMYTSANAVLRFAREAAPADKDLSLLVDSPQGFTPHQVALLAETGNAAAIGVFHRLGCSLGIGIAGLLSTLDLPLIVVGGGVAAAWDLFSPSMFTALRQYSVVYRLALPTQTANMERDRTFVRPATLGSNAGLLGAAMLPGLAAAHTIQ